MKPIKLLEIFCIDVKLFDEQEKESKRMKNDYRYFIAISGICKDCGYPIICEAGDILEAVPNIDGELDMGDFHLYCSNPDCKHHTGLCTFDTEINEEYVPFLDQTVKYRKQEGHSNCRH